MKENANLKEQSRATRTELEEAQEKIEQLKTEVQYLKTAGKETYNDRHVTNDLNRKYNQTLNEKYNLVQQQEAMKREYENKLNFLAEENKKQKNEIEQLKHENNKLNVNLLYLIIERNKFNTRRHKTSK